MAPSLPSTSGRIASSDPAAGSVAGAGLAGTGPAGVGGVAVLYLYELKTLLGVATACPIRLDEKYARLRGTARADANSLLCNAMVVIKRLS